MAGLKPLVSQWFGHVKAKKWTFHDHYSVGPAINLSSLLASVLPGKYHTTNHQYLVPGYHFLYNNQPNILLGSDWYDNYQSPVDSDLKPLYKRRLWVGGQIDFHTPTRLATAMECEESITSVRNMFDTTFVTIKRNYTTEDASPILNEVRTLAYTNELYKPSNQTLTFSDDEAAHVIPFTLSASDIGRYCALTYNLHKIHSDPHYCRTQEHLPNVLVPGPFMVTVALSLTLRLLSRGQTIKSIKYKNIEPCFVNTPLQMIVKPVGDSEEQAYLVLLISAEAGKKFMDSTIKCVP